MYHQFMCIWCKISLLVYGYCKIKKPKFIAESLRNMNICSVFIECCIKFLNV